MTPKKSCITSLKIKNHTKQQFKKNDFSNLSIE